MSTANSVREELAAAIGSEYEIVRELGRGGASVVYLARDRVLGREVAIKVIRDTHVGDAEAVARFQREARTLASLQHPNIVMLYGAKALPDGSLALVMQHGYWGTLKSVIRDQGPMSVEAVERVLRDLASALCYLHRHGIVHRDIKPENIFIESDTGKALLSDFGIAKSGDARASVTLTGVVIGTPAYMSPEQIDGAELTGRSDLYSLGMVGYEMLTGTRPWDGENLFNVIFKQKTEKLPSVRNVRPDAPASLCLLIDKATEKEPRARWASAEELLEQLTGEEVPAAPPPRVMDSVALVPLPEDPGAVEPYATVEIERIVGEADLMERERAQWRRRRVMVASVAALLLGGGAGAVAMTLGTTPWSSAALLPERPQITESAEAAGPANLELEGLPSEPALATGDSNVAVIDTPLAMLEIPTTPTPPAAEPPARVPVSEPEPRDSAPAAVAEPELPVVLLTPRISRGTPPTAQPTAGAVWQQNTTEVVRPEMLNRPEFVQRLWSLYPSHLRAQGVTSTVHVGVMVDRSGRVVDSRITRSSGRSEVDQAVLGAASSMRFTPAPDARGPQRRWVEVPLTFAP